jgi:hypothetical protein
MLGQKTMSAKRRGGGDDGGGWVRAIEGQNGIGAAAVADQSHS